MALSLQALPAKGMKAGQDVEPAGGRGRGAGSLR